MKFLLTSGGLSNTSITTALEELLGKPIAESSALLVPTAIYPFDNSARQAYDVVVGKAPSPLAELGWKSLGVLELTALPTIRPENWQPALQEADALLVWGGDVLYLTHWMRESGLAALLPSLDLVYVGVSAGSITVTPWNCDAEFDLDFIPDGSEMGRDAERSLGLVDFTLIPHVDDPDAPNEELDALRKWMREAPCPTYLMDDDTALRVVDGEVDVVSEGKWRLVDR